jgi:hypothetical protein
MPKVYEGSCHCQSITFSVTADLTNVVDCNCSICTKKGFLHLVVEKRCFNLRSGEGELMTYKFNSGVATHMFCRTCGCHPFYVPRSAPEKISVNARCLDGIDVASLAPQPFDGKNWEAAIQTRAPVR